jgi:hypothetical protein
MLLDLQHLINVLMFVIALISLICAILRFYV